MKTTIATLIIILSAFIFESCGSLRGMRVQVMRPAQITIPQEIQNISLLNRAVPSNGKNLEGSLTGEFFAKDKELSEDCMKGVNSTLLTSDRFKVVRCDTAFLASDPKSISFGGQLKWSVVDSLCKSMNTQALMVLEFFDTDFNVFNPAGTAANAVGNILNGNLSPVEVRGTATANAGFRVYFPRTQSVLYEDQFRYKKVWTQTSTNPIEAVAKMVKKPEALRAVSFEAGGEFAMNVVPLYFWEQRQMYKGKKGALQIGERQALAKDWEAAAKTWTNGYEESFKTKIRAKAAYNAALAYEVLGNLKEAQRWIQIAYVENGKNEALTYSNILDARVREQDKLNQQLGQ